MMRGAGWKFNNFIVSDSYYRQRRCSVHATYIYAEQNIYRVLDDTRFGVVFRLALLDCWFGLDYLFRFNDRNTPRAISLQSQVVFVHHHPEIKFVVQLYQNQYLHLDLTCQSLCLKSMITRAFGLVVGDQESM